MIFRLFSFIATGSILAFASPVQAAYVTPQMGGGQVEMMSGAPMKHLDVSFDGTDLSVHIDETVATPWLRPLTPPDEFDPAQPWSVLSDKSYNFQYGWNSSGFISLPENSGIWIELLETNEELETFARPPANEPSYSPLFQNVGDTWQWTGSMTHNAYAVLDPAQSSYSATYRVYIGDATTGELLDDYGSDEVTLMFQATPVPEPSSLTGLAIFFLMSRRRR